VCDGCCQKRSPIECERRRAGWYSMLCVHPGSRCALYLVHCYCGHCCVQHVLLVHSPLFGCGSDNVEAIQSTSSLSSMSTCPHYVLVTAMLNLCETCHLRFTPPSWSKHQKGASPASLLVRPGPALHVRGPCNDQLEESLLVMAAAFFHYIS